jgi:hypothetical protein
VCETQFRGAGLGRWAGWISERSDISCPKNHETSNKVKVPKFSNTP